MYMWPSSYLGMSLIGLAGVKIVLKNILTLFMVFRRG